MCQRAEHCRPREHQWLQPTDGTRGIDPRQQAAGRRADVTLRADDLPGARETLALLDAGELRVAEKGPEGWKVNAKRIYRLYTEEGLKWWLRSAVILSRVQRFPRPVR